MLRNLIRGFSSRPNSFRLFSSSAAEIDFAASAELGAKVLSHLEQSKPLRISNADLRTMVVELCVSNPSNLPLAGKILEKAILKVPEFDIHGRVSSFYLNQLIENNELSIAVEYLILMIKAPLGVQSDLDEFGLSSVWRALITNKEDVLALDLLKACKETTFPKVVEALTDRGFKDDAMLKLFLPRLNWAAIEYLVADSVQEGQINVSVSVLHDIFHVVLAPNSNDLYHDSVDVQSFTSDVINPRFHRLLELLQSWKNSGIPIKGRQMSKALEETFKQFLPTEPMMDDLQKLL